MISEEAFWRVQREESDEQEHEKKNNTQNDSDLDWLNNLMLPVADAFGNGGGKTNTINTRITPTWNTNNQSDIDAIGNDSTTAIANTSREIQLDH